MTHEHAPPPELEERVELFLGRLTRERRRAIGVAERREKQTTFALRRSFDALRLTAASELRVDMGCEEQSDAEG